jgi:hypothetical protein
MPWSGNNTLSNVLSLIVNIHISLTTLCEIYFQNEGTHIDFNQLESVEKRVFLTLLMELHRRALILTYHVKWG